MAGLQTATYIVLAEHPEVVTDRPEGVRHLQAEHLAFVALDCELRGLTEESLHEAIQLVQEAGHRCVIYTGAWFWEGRLGDPEWAAHMPLWDSLLRRHPISLIPGRVWTVGATGQLWRLGGPPREAVRGHERWARFQC